MDNKLIWCQDAINEIQRFLGYLDQDMINRIKIAIENLPSAEPERKKGKWVEVEDFYNRISGRCSVCGWEAHMHEDDVVGMPFCPDCGADMRQREEQE